MCETQQVWWVCLTEGKKPWATFGTTFPVPSLPRMCLVPLSVLHQEILWTRLQDSAKKSQSARKTSCSAALLRFGRGYRELHLHTATVQRAKQSSLLCYNDGKLHMVKGWEYASMRSKHQISTQIHDKNLMKEYDNIESGIWENHKGKRLIFPLCPEFSLQRYSNTAASWFHSFLPSFTHNLKFDSNTNNSDIFRHSCQCFAILEASFIKYLFISVF